MPDTKKGKKILIRANTDAELAALLRELATVVEHGNACANVVTSNGVRVMRPLRDNECDWFIDARDLP